MNFSISGDETKIEIEVFTHSYPDSSDYWAGNWLNAKVECEIPGFTAKFGLSLRTDEINDFSEQLKEMNRGMSSKAALYNLDGYVQIEGSMDEPGSINWAVALCYPAGNGASLKFDFQSDRNDLHELVKELDGILSVFPVIGAPESSAAF